MMSESMLQTVYNLHKCYPCNIQCSETYSRYQWPHGARRGSTAVGLLGLLVRIPPGDMNMSVSGVVCCQVDFPATS